MKIKKVILASALILSGLLLSNVTTINAIEELELPSIMRKFEAIHAEFNKVSNATSYTAKYKADNDSTYKDLDNELVRIKDDKVIVDVVGLKEGYYNVKLIPNVGDEIELRDIEVFSDDRSGYAHFGYNDGIGAYKDDGTLKDNATVLYVTEDTKNNPITYKNKTYNNFVDLLTKSESKDPLVIRFVGKISAATWKKIDYKNNINVGESTVEKLAENFYDINIKDSTGKNSFSYTGSSYSLDEDQLIDGNYNELDTTQYSKLNNLNSKLSISKEKKTKSGISTSVNNYDSCWNDCQIKSMDYVTLEGIGLDAEIFQWGFTVSNCNSIEVKNLTFTDYPEDAIGIQGNNSDASVYGNYWIHNCTFNQGKNYWDPTYEQDKHEGDGATDFKGGHGLTISYCKYNDTHKTCLIGGDDKNLQKDITLHHNYYLNATSRMPLVRQANIHMYNNYYKGIESAGLSSRAKCNAFVENCYFENGKNPLVIVPKSDKLNEGTIGTSIKAVGNIFAGDYTLSTNKSDGYNYDHDGIYYVSSTTEATSQNVTSQTLTRDTQVEKSRMVGYIDYANFDTNSSIFYYDDVKHESNVKLMHNATEVPEFCKRYSGVKFEETEETILRLGYQIGTYTKDNSQYYAVRFIGKINFSDEFELSDVDKIVFNFKIYDNDDNLVKEVSNVRIESMYNVLYSSDNNVVAPRINNTKYFYQIINNITPSQNGYKIKAFVRITEEYDISDEIEYVVDVL